MLKRLVSRPILAVPVLLAALVLAVPAVAVASTPGWEIDTVHPYPTNLPPGGAGYLELHVYNAGAQASSGVITVTDVLPASLSATAAYATNATTDSSGGLYGGSFVASAPENQGRWHCGGQRVVTCTSDPAVLPEVLQGELVKLVVAVKVAPVASGMEETNEVTVAGGGALTPVSVSSQVAFGSTVPGFRFAHFDGWLTNAGGTPDTQAGSHPYELGISFDIANGVRAENGERVNQPRNIAVNAPPGLVGNPHAVPQCPVQRFDLGECPADTQVGVDTAYSGENRGRLPEIQITQPVYNLVAPGGVPAEFGFTLLGFDILLDAGVRSGTDYGITEHVDNLPEKLEISGNTTILWGVPAEAAHDPERCTSTGGGGASCGQPGSSEVKPLLTLPTSCGSPPSFSIEGDSWEEPNVTAKNEFTMHDSDGEPVGVTGCEKLVHYNPTIAIAPDTTFADTPAGLTTDVKVPQEGLLAPEGLATPNLKDTTVVLPPGVVINPGQAAGLQACQAAEAHVGDGKEDAPSCPNASKVGTVQIATPLLKENLEGNVYVLQSNPPSLKLLVAASGQGVNLKLVGDAELCETAGQVINGKTCEAPGQLITTFSETPELPFTDFKLSFSGGAQAALATPTTCGVYTTTSDFMPWSTPSVPDAFPTSSFQITAGPGGSACPSSPLPFTPSLIAGATTDQAGGFTNFSLLLQSGDGQQRIEKLQFKAPEGLSGMLSAVPLCPEPQAAQGTCSSASQIGHASVAAGPGPYPLSIPQPGDPESPIYLTGPYQGAPFGLTIVTHAIAGPFNLGNVITRARIEVDIHTAQITVTTDPLPQVIDGVPTDLRLVDSVIDRPGFMFNPTNCNPSSFSGTATGTPPPGVGGPGATAAISSHFQVGSCQSLKFAPSFKVSTSGKTSRSKGASLDAKVIYPAVPLAANQAAGEANIASVKVDLPKQLPSRLTTLQKACTAAQFDANPAGCPSASVIGHATAITQVLPVPLTGPAIFVSHGGEAFPSLIIVLQGYGVTVDLVASTFISKSGITSSTFKTLPDVPFKSFDLNLPEGKYSALAANGNLCTSKLAMPTAFVGQNGAVIHESTPISVTGCAKVKALTRAQKLTAALKVCHKKAKGKQAACKKNAHRRYGAIRAKKKG
jgi:hypothetical protein